MKTRRGVILSASIAWLLLSCPAAWSGEPADAETQFQRARAHLSGKGASKDPQRAFELMKEAAEQGHAEALGGMGYFYATGTAVEKDEAKAVEWFRKGAEKGSAKAQLNLGKMLVDGKGVPKNEEEGRMWIRKAAGQELPEALLEEGMIFYFGKYGEGVNYQEAFPFLLKAAEYGNAQAQNMTGFMLQNGMGVTEDAGKAEQWFRKAAEQGQSKAQSNLGRLLGPQGGDTAKRREALTWLMLAAAQNEVTAQKTLEEVLPKADEADITEARKRVTGFHRALWRRPAVR